MKTLLDSQKKPASSYMRKVVHWGWLIGLGLLSQLAMAGQTVDKTLATVAEPYVKIEHINGKAEIKTWNKKEVKVTGELGDRTEEFTFTSKGDEVVIEVEVERYRNNWLSSNQHDGDDLTIYVPASSRVKYNSVNARVNIDGITNSSDIEVVNGEVVANNLTGKISIESVNGDVEINNVNGDLVVNTVNGEIRGDHSSVREARFESVNGGIKIKTNSPDVVAETVNGSINLTLDKVKKLSINTVNGRASVSMFLINKGEVNASSVGGKIELVFQDNVSARFDIEAHAGGNITNRISNDKMKKDKYGPHRWLEFSHRGGEGRVEVSTVSGNVVLDTH